MLRKRSLIAVVGIAFVMTSMVSAAGQSGLTAELELLDASQAGLVVLFSLTNESSQDVHVLTYETPLKGIETNLFVVELDGARLPYVGIEPYRLGPLPESWLRIAAGETVSAKVNLADSYNLVSEGEYSISYKAHQQVLSGQMLPTVTAADTKALSLETAPTTVTSDSISFRLSYNEVPAPSIDVELMDPSSLQKNNYGICSSYGSTSDLSGPKSTGWTLANNAYNCGWSCNNWHKDWFGDACSYLSSVRGRFLSTRNYLADYWYFHCGSQAPACRSNWIAYVYHGSPRHVYICPSYWSYSNKPHVLVHEANHWTCTTDYTYGYWNCRNLADSSAYQAYNNADNYAYAADYACY